MRFTWDIRKSDRNVVERGFDFVVAAAIFFEPTVERIDGRIDYGEPRTIAIGRVESVLLTVVYTDRVAADGSTERRIISARLSNRRERQAYEEAYPNR